MKVKLKMPKEHGARTMFSVWNKFGDPDYIGIPNNCNIKSLTIEYYKELKHNGKYRKSNR